ncbi:MAG: sulfurtransferase [Nitrospinae bacterium]|nr:sulfurtransferase [Nitrospinota bacterium]
MALLITPETLRSMPRKETILVDTRSFFKYLVGHIPGAVHLGGWEGFTRKVDGVRGLLIEDRRFIAERLKAFGIGHGKTIVVYGEPKDPWRTDGRFFWMFERYGFNRVAILEGGLARWKETGGTVERGRGETPTPSSLTANDIHFNDAVATDQAWIAERLGSSGLAIVDNRTRKEFDGATPYGSARGGHIPNAVHIHWPDFFTPRGLMKSKDALTRMMKRYGIRPDQEVVVYCTGGVRSGMAYFVFRFLGYKVRNYDGSWWDWSLNLNLPVENS